jgi:hypothetical protein
MDETQKMLEAKTSAVTALSEALQRGIREERITNLQDVGHFLDAWTGAMVEMTQGASRAESWDGQSEPQIGTVVVDKDDDRWMRMSNGQWYMFSKHEDLPRSANSRRTEGDGDCWSWVNGTHGPLRPYVA